MKKFRLLILTLLSMFLLSACAGNTSGQSVSVPLTPEETADLLMESLRTLNLDLINEYSDNYVSSEQNWLGVTVRKEFQVFNNLLQPFQRKGKRYQSNYRFSQKLMETLSWEIKAVRQEGTQAEIDMKITNIDMQKITGYYTISLLENMIASEGTGLTGIIGDFYGLIRSAGSGEDLTRVLEQTDPGNPDNLSSIDITLSAYQEKGVWKIHLNDDFINAFMGNISAEGYSKEIEKRIDELTLQYEEKVSRMAEQTGRT